MTSLGAATRVPPSPSTIPRTKPKPDRSPRPGAATKDRVASLERHLVPGAAGVATIAPTTGVPVMVPRVTELSPEVAV